MRRSSARSGGEGKLGHKRPRPPLAARRRVSTEAVPVSRRQALARSCPLPGARSPAPDLARVRTNGLLTRRPDASRGTGTLAAWPLAGGKKLRRGRQNASQKKPNGPGLTGPFGGRWAVRERGEGRRTRDPGSLSPRRQGRNGCLSPAIDARLRVPLAPAEEEAGELVIVAVGPDPPKPRTGGAARRGCGAGLPRGAGDAGADRAWEAGMSRLPLPPSGERLSQFSQRHRELVLMAGADDEQGSRDVGRCVAVLDREPPDNVVAVGPHPEAGIDGAALSVWSRAVRRASRVRSHGH